MKKMLSVGILGATFLAAPSYAEQSVTINGRIHTCTNSCNVQISGGSYTICDCCGGRVRISFPPPETPPTQDE